MLKNPLALISQSVGGVGGNLNYIKNPVQSSAITNWAKGSGTLLSAPAWSTTQNLYGGGAMLVTWGVGSKTSNDYFEGGLSEIMTSMVGKSWKVSFTTFIDSGNTFVPGDLIVEYFDGTNTVPVGIIPIITGQVFLTELYLYPSSAIGTTATLRIRSLAGSATCVGNLRIADVAIAPNAVIAVPALSVESSFSPVFTGLGSVTGLDAKYTRVGNKMKGLVRVTTGIPTGVEAQMTLPPGITTDSLIPTIEIAGIMSAGVGAPNTYYVLQEPSKGYLTFGIQASGSASLTKALGNAMFSVTTTYSFTFEVTIAQWSSQISLAGFNDPMYLSNSQSGLNTAGAVGTSYYGMDGSLIPANTLATFYDITLPRTPLVNEMVKIEVRSKIDKTWVPIEIAGIASALVPSLTGYFFGPSGVGRITGIFVNKITAGILRVQFSQDAIGANNYAAAASASSVAWSSVTGAADGYDRWRVRIGPGAIAETSKVVLDISCANNQSLTNTIVQYTFGTVTTFKNTHSIVSGNSLVIPVPGDYRITAFASSSLGNTPSTAYPILYVFKNGTQIMTLVTGYPIVGFGFNGSPGSMLVTNLNIGDVITLSLFNTATEGTQYANCQVQRLQLSGPNAT